MGVDVKQAKEGLDLTTTLHLGVRSVVSSPTPEKLEASLSLLSADDREILDHLRPEDAMLIVHRGPGRGARFLLKGADSTIGRAPESDIFLDDVTVSRHHAKVHAKGHGKYSLEDLGSLNGTYLNNSSATLSPLHAADEIQIGKFHMLFFGGK